MDNHPNGTKICRKCGQEKSLDQFSMLSNSPDKIHPRCKDCRRAYYKEYFELNKEKVREKNRRWHAENPEKSKELRNNYYYEHKEQYRNWRSKWKKENKERVSKARRLNREKNIDKYREKDRLYQHKRRKSPQYKLSAAISIAIWRTLKGSKSGQHWEDLVGYTFEQFKKHIEKQFQPGMSWDNYGKGGWDIDHKIPISVFNFNSPEDIDFKKCWALKNLQPMWGSANYSKNNRIDKPFQPSLAIGVING